MVYLDVFIKSIKQGSKIRLKAISGQAVPELYLSCSRKNRGFYKVGTIYKTDVKLVERKKGRSYLIVRYRNKPLEAALEYYEHNISLA
jgi:hypothetical protein